MQATKQEDYDKFEDGPRGSYFFFSKQGKITAVGIVCPGCGEKSILSVDNVGRKHWDLVREEPITLMPSVFHNVDSCGWHGNLINGEFIGG